MKKILLLFATILFVGCQQPMDTDVIGIVKSSDEKTQIILSDLENYLAYGTDQYDACLLYTSPSPRDPKTSRMPSSA